MAIFGSIETVRAQTPRTAAFTVAWRYVEELQQTGSSINRRLLALDAGASARHELGQGVFVIEQAYDTKPRAEGFFESHRKYIDIQVVVAGEEIMEVIDRSRATVRDPYQEPRDLCTYKDATDVCLLRVRGGDAAVFFPVDVHMPSLRVGPAVRVWKSVLKVPVEAGVAP